MGFLSDFSEEMNRTYSVYPKLTTLDGDDEVNEGFAAVATLTGIQCAYWTGSAAENLISDRYKTEASGVVVSSIGTVPDGAKIVLDNGLEFIVVNADDVMFQGDILVIAVKAVDYGTTV